MSRADDAPARVTRREVTLATPSPRTLSPCTRQLLLRHPFSTKEHARENGTIWCYDFGALPVVIPLGHSLVQLGCGHPAGGRRREPLVFSGKARSGSGRCVISVEPSWKLEG